VGIREDGVRLRAFISAFEIGTLGVLNGGRRSGCRLLFSAFYTRGSTQHKLNILTPCLLSAVATISSEEMEATGPLSALNLLAYVAMF
jgi:hypothetical protein